MAAMAVSAQAGERPWISPREQLERLIKVDGQVVTEVTSVLPAALAEVVAKYLGELPSRLSDWYTGLERFKMLPKIIPPLPVDIHDQIKPSDKLYWISPGSVKQFEIRANNYGYEHLEEFGGKNPFPALIWENIARNEHDNTLLDQGMWVVISNDLFKSSRGLSYRMQLNALAELGQEVPTLFVMVSVAFLDKVVSGKNRLPEFNLEGTNGYIRVQETTDEIPLIIGEFARGKMSVIPSNWIPIERQSVLGMKKL